MNIAEYLERKRIDVDRFRDLVAPRAVTPPTALHKSMRDSLLAGGKRVRPILTIAVMEVIGPSEESDATEGGLRLRAKTRGILNLIPHTHQCLLRASRSRLVSGLLPPAPNLFQRRFTSPGLVACELEISPWFPPRREGSMWRSCWISSYDG